MESRSLTLLAVVVALALGFGGGFLVGNDRRPVEDPSPARSGDPDRRSEGSPASAIAPTPRRDARKRSAARPGPAAPAPVSDASIARAVRDASDGVEDEPAAGDLAISGVVVDRDGAAVEGAVVQVVPRLASDLRGELRRADRRLGGGAPMSPVEEASRAARLAFERRRGAHDATSDASGAFEVGGVRPGLYTVRAYSAGFDCEPVEVKAGQRIEIVLEPVQAVLIEPRLPDGSTPGSAVVAQRLEHDRVLFHAWSPDAPTIEVSDPVVELSVLAGEVIPTTDGDRAHATLQSPVKIVDVEVRLGEPVRFDLAPRAVVRVNVVERGVRIGRGYTQVSIARSGADDDATRMLRLEDGRWAAAVPKPGEYEVTARRRPLSTATASVVATAGEVANVTLELPAHDPAQFIEITCVGPDGEPVRDVVFGKRFRGRVHEAALGDGIARPGGRYWLLPARVHPPGAEPEEDGVTVVGTSERFGRSEAWIPRGASAATLRFSAPSEVSVLINGDPGDRLGYVVVPADTMDLDGAIRETTRKRSYWEGERVGVPIDAGRLTPGDYDFYLYSLVWRDFGYLALARRVTLAPGRTLVELNCPPLDTVEVLVPGAEKGTDVLITPLERSRAAPNPPHATVGDDGRAALEGLPPGRYRVLARVRSETLTADITVPSGAVQLRPVEDDGEGE